MNRQKLQSHARRGFSFAEVMFAVVILGVGFILVAAIFPVAIQQSQASGEESAAAAMARTAAAAIAATPVYMQNYIAINPTNPITPSKTVQYLPVFPPTAKNCFPGTAVKAATAVTPGYASVLGAPVVVPFVGSRWDFIKANAILPNDPRYSFAAFYKRSNNSSLAQLIVISSICRNRPQYDPTVDPYSYNVSSSSVTTKIRGGYLAPAIAPVSQQTVILPDLATINNGSEGAYVTLAASSQTGFTGRSFMLGRAFSGSNFELEPGDDLQITAGADGNWGTDKAITEPASTASCQVNPPATLQPTVAYATLTYTADAPSGRITLFKGVGNSQGDDDAPPAAAPGAFVVIADDFPFDPQNYGDTTLLPGSAGSASGYSQPVMITPALNSTSAMPFAPGALNGRVFRLANAPTTVTSAGGTFNLDIAYGMRPPVTAIFSTGGNSVAPYSPDTVPNPDLVEFYRSPSAHGAPPSITANTYLGGKLRCKVYIIGVGKADPSSPTYTPAGSAQDIGCYSTFMQVK